MSPKFISIVLIDSFIASGLLTKEEGDKAVKYLINVPAGFTAEDYMEWRKVQL